MEQPERVVAFPSIGDEYNAAIARMLTSLGLKVLMPPAVSERTIKFGVRHSADMMCFPYKVTLGNFIEMLDKGANTLLMYDSCGRCRLRHYYKLHEFTLKKLGYKFEVYPISGKTIVPILCKLSKKNAFAVLKTVINLVREIREINRKSYCWKDKLNIGIIGEIYTCCESRVNYQVELRLRQMGANPYNTATLYEFIIESIKHIALLQSFGKRKYKQAAKAYLNGPLGGHGFENIYNLLWLVDKKVDGIIHLLPLSCMPEATVDPIIDDICQKSGTPLLRLLIDETNSEANIVTRLETFVELIKRKKNEVLARH